MTFKEFELKKQEFLIYIEVEKNLSDHTCRAYEGDLEQLYQFWKKNNKIQKSELTLRTSIERFLIALYHKKMDKSSIARKLSCFQSFEKFLMTQGVTLSLNLTRPRLDKKLPQYLSIDEMLHLLDEVKHEDLPSKRPHRDKTIIELLYATGIRCAELVRITLRDINIEEKTIRIFGKGRKERLVLFGSKAQTMIIQYLQSERPPIQTDTEPLFINYRNQALTTRSIQRIFEMFRQFLKTDRPITPHKMRHSFATHLLKQGTDLRIVQELLGHKTLASTEKYTHVSPQDLITMCDTLHPMNYRKKD